MAENAESGQMVTPMVTPLDGKPRTPTEVERQRDRSRSAAGRDTIRNPARAAQAAESAAHPEAAAVLAALQDAPAQSTDALAKPKGKAGRKHGSKNRPAAERIREQAMAALAEKGKPWWSKVLAEAPYIGAQLLKHLTPRAAEAKADDDGASDAEIVVRQVRADGSPADDAPAPVADAPAPDVAHVAVAPAAPTPSPDDLAAAVLERAKSGDSEAMQIIEAAAERMGVQLDSKRQQAKHTAEQAKAERERLERENETANRLRMFNTPECWNN